MYLHTIKHEGNKFIGWIGWAISWLFSRQILNYLQDFSFSLTFSLTSLDMKTLKPLPAHFWHLFSTSTKLLFTIILSLKWCQISVRLFCVLPGTKNLQWKHKMLIWQNFPNYWLGLSSFQQLRWGYCWPLWQKLKFGHPLSLKVNCYFPIDEFLAMPATSKVQFLLSVGQFQSLSLDCSD